MNPSPVFFSTIRLVPATGAKFSEALNIPPVSRTWFEVIGMSEGEL